jgi:hypothetical protein
VGESERRADGSTMRAKKLRRENEREGRLARGGRRHSMRGIGCPPPQVGLGIFADEITGLAKGDEPTEIVNGANACEVVILAEWGGLCSVNQAKKCAQLRPFRRKSIQAGQMSAPPSGQEVFQNPPDKREVSQVSEQASLKRGHEQRVLSAKIALASPSGMKLTHRCAKGKGIAESRDAIRPCTDSSIACRLGKKHHLPFSHARKQG